MRKWIVRILAVLVVLAAAGIGYYQAILKNDVAAYRRRAVPALMYHSISRPAPGWPREMCVSPESFEAQKRWLKEQGYRAVTVPEARAALLAGGDVSHLVLLTFDDGYKDNYTVAFPILKKYGFRGNFYVIGKHIGKSYVEAGLKEYMDKPMLLEMHQAGMELGSHSMSHDPLAKIAPHYLPLEIYEPLNIFSRRDGGLHWFIHGIAFPNGSYNDAVLAEVRKYPKLEYGFSGIMGANTKETFERTLFELRRNGIYEQGNPTDEVAFALRKAYVVGYLDSRGFPVRTLQAILDHLKEWRSRLSFRLG